MTRVFKQLQRVRKHALDEQQKALARKRLIHEAIIKDIERINQEFVEQLETVRHNTHLMHYFQNYRQNYQIRLDRLNQDRQRAEKEVADAEDLMRVLYGEKKKIDIITERREKEEEMEMNRKQQIISDEQFLTRKVHRQSL